MKTCRIWSGPLALVAASLALGGCVSIGGAGEPPASLLTLTSSASAPVGSGTMAGAEGSEGTIAVLTPEVPAKLDVIRVPVTVSPTEIAYLQEAVWIEKPARLFRRLLGETLRTASGEAQTLLVLDTDDTPLRPNQSLRGTLIDMGYEPATSSVVVRYEAVHTLDDGRVMSRRFEAREEGIPPVAANVAPALNRAANTVAKDVAAWVLSAE
ncbi:membrane integrity-associated transporter subunit PqiC [Erythrobacter sp. SCSIO 43205]|uniref:ABC-type transport auxiliary lipoprotein family protein n=1 Tax=Erythrobacter sp. SCSIO 43205 TaxID=2779361 RepID=UPI001CAA3066|nr:ABC-type transport auxiliary lipoprotein family protein [Erythrobacter sp. SCSIO 43205]UAB79082.1 membrane integrity-associated transporter subunit PqiC [Erythrobacter sp. SCSIO 43205]